MIDDNRLATAYNLTRNTAANWQPTTRDNIRRFPGHYFDEQLGVIVDEEQDGEGVGTWRSR
jgi:hypothetical protein